MVRDLFDDLMDRVERRDPWADYRREPVEDDEPVVDDAVDLLDEYYDD